MCAPGTTVYSFMWLVIVSRRRIGWSETGQFVCQLMRLVDHDRHALRAKIKFSSLKFQCEQRSLLFRCSAVKTSETGIYTLLDDSRTATFMLHYNMNKIHLGHVGRCVQHHKPALGIFRHCELKL